MLNGKAIHRVCELELGYGTNNEAEFDILIEALTWSLAGMDACGLDPMKFHLHVFSDSTIVVNRLRGRNKRHKTEPEQRMHALALRALVILNKFHSHDVQWHSRLNNVKRFGH